MISAGIDIGSVATKAALVTKDGYIGGRVGFTGYNAARAGRDVLDGLLAEHGLSRGDIGRVTATGYGRGSVDFADLALTEIICHGAGAYYQDANVRSIIDIGGQDSKVIILDDSGRVVNFAMNDKCAAGTGRFLEVMARALETDLEGFPALAARSVSPAQISNLCTVFAESEVVSLIAKGAPREDIVAGLHKSAAERVASMARRAGVREPVMMTGGVAKNAALVAALEAELGMRVAASPLAQVNGALGAAVMGMRE